MEYPQLITTAEAAHMLRISKSKVWKLMKDGHLGSVTIGRSRRITKDQVLDFVRSLHNA